MTVFDIYFWNNLSVRLPIDVNYCLETQYQEVVAVGGKNSNTKAGCKGKKQKGMALTASRGKGRQGKPGSPGTLQMSKAKVSKPFKMEPLVKEEGEMSDTEEVYEQFKEVKWREWCEDVMADEEKTLKRLQRLQSTSADLPKEKVLSKIRNYLQLLGRRIDQIVLEYEEGPYKKERMRTRLWNYVSTFSNLSGERLHQIYSKLKQEQQLAAGVGPSQMNGSVPGDQTSAFMHRGIDTEKFEAWKRRRRAEADAFQAQPIQPSYQRSMINGARLPDPNSSGILGAAPSDNRHLGNGRPFRGHQSGFPPRHGFSSGVK